MKAASTGAGNDGPTDTGFCSAATSTEKAEEVKDEPASAPVKTEEAKKFNTEDGGFIATPENSKGGGAINDHAHSKGGLSTIIEASPNAAIADKDDDAITVISIPNSKIDDTPEKNVSAVKEEGKEASPKNEEQAEQIFAAAKAFNFGAYR